MRDRRNLPAVNLVLQEPAAKHAAEIHGHVSILRSIREVMRDLRGAETQSEGLNVAEIANLAATRLDVAERTRSIKPVFNLTGVVLHTNLGRALLAEEAISAAVTAMRQNVALEFDFEAGGRGDREDYLRDLICELTDAEDATFVNNNAAAVMLVLNALGKDREAVVSRGELIEIGGSFRMPEIMEQAGTKLREVGTTNRTHESDYANALGPAVGLILKIHPSNYRVEGFSFSVSARALARLAKEAALPLVHDLGSGTLIKLAKFGLPDEVTVKQAVEDGADLVTFSGDKLLGGPQAGVIVGRKELVDRLRRSPMKRAMRLDKIRIAALEATLKLYRHCERLESRLPTIRQLSRPIAELTATAERIAEALRNVLDSDYSVEVVASDGEIGSGAAPAHKIASAAIRIAPNVPGKSLDELRVQLCSLPVPVLGRTKNSALFLDMRCLEDETGILNNFQQLVKSSSLQ